VSKSYELLARLLSGIFKISALIIEVNLRRQKSMMFVIAGLVGI